jgi:signal transduction histidine kinase
VPTEVPTTADPAQATCRVLVVEDDPGFAELTAEFLRDTSGDVCTVGTLAAGLERILAGGVDCVVLDLGLPDAEGLEAVTAILALVDPPPVVVLTGDGDPDRALAAVALGAQDYLAKRAVNPSNLNRSISYAVERHRLERRLRASARLEGVGRLAGRIAHDYNNLLTATFGHLELARLDAADLDEAARITMTQHLDAIEAASIRAAELTRQLLTYSRAQLQRREIVSVGELVEGLLPVLTPLLAGCDVVVERTDLPDHVEIGRSELEEVVSNLALNARDAMPDGGHLALSVSVVPDEAHPDRVRLCVTDDGSGMDAALTARMFEPFMTTKTHGTGLGLATVRSIVDAAGGTIAVESHPGQGTTITIDLPWIAAPAPTAPAAVAIPTSTQRILVVDDEAPIRRFLVHVLQAHGHEVTEVADPREVLGRLEEHPHQLLVTDVVMPELDGRELVRLVREQRPTLPILVISGFADEGLEQLFTDPSITFLPKPFGGAELRDAVDAALRAAAPDPAAP